MIIARDRPERFALSAFAAAGRAKKDKSIVSHERSAFIPQAAVSRKGESTALTVVDQGVDIYASSSTVEAHASIDQRKNRVVPSEPNVFSGHKFRPALTHDDVAGDNHFAAEFFDTQPFADAVPAILNAALSFFVSHISVRRWMLALVTL